MKKLLFPIMALALLLASCDNENPPAAETPDKSSAADFMKKRIGDRRQIHKFDAAAGTSVTLTGGTKFTVPANAFTKNGQPVTGEVTLEFFEVMPGKRSAGISTGTNTNYYSGGSQQYLVTDGYFYIDAKQNGTGLDKKLAEKITVSVPTKKADGATTYLWRGFTTAGLDADQFSWTDWTEDLYTTRVTGGQGVVSAGNGSFTFDFGEIGWWNCDIFWSEYDMESTEWTTLEVTLGGQFGEIASYQGGSGDTFVFFYPKGSDVIAQLYSTEYGDKAAEANDENEAGSGETATIKVCSYKDSIPVGTVGKLLAFSIKEGKYSLGSKEITVTADMQVTLDLVNCTESEITNAIAGLDSYK